MTFDERHQHMSPRQTHDVSLHQIEREVFLQSVDLSIAHLATIAGLIGEVARRCADPKASETYEIAQEALGWLIQQRAHLANMGVLLEAQRCALPPHGAIH